MKKIISSLLSLPLIWSVVACSDEDYTSKYEDPSKTNTTSCEKLMTGVFYAGRDYTFNSYWRMFTWDNGIMGTYAQTIGFLNTPGNIYSANDSYANDRWENFYNVLTQFRTLQNVYKGLPQDEQTANRIFYDLAEVFVYDHLSQLIDVFGDVPFEKAGYLSLTGDVSGSYASYDKAEVLYEQMLDRLGVLSKDIQSLQANLPAQAAALLPGQDFLNQGNLDRWVRYANSLRLRLAVRVASQGTLAAKGKQVVAEILNGGLPVVSQFSETIQAIPDGDGFNYEENFRDGYKDHSRASQAMLDLLLTKATLGEDDPRLPVMYSKNAAGTYKGLSTRESQSEQEANVALAEDKRVYSRIDSTTVIFNKNLKSPIMTAAEVDFLRAESFQKGWANGDAKAAFVAGVLHSTQFYYDLNKISESSYSPKKEMPAEATVTAYAEKLWNAATNKEEAIVAQKWLNFGFMQPYQAWNEVRRTGYPTLYYPTDNTAQLLKTLPNRVVYPASERSNNTTFYKAQVEAMGGKDDAYGKIFWAK